MEYEYSYRVKDLSKCIEYVAQNYEFIEKIAEQRTIYRTDETIARITIRNDEMFLDFKDNKVMVNAAIERRETRAMKFENREVCEEILYFLGYEKDDTVVRTRSIYEGEGIKFEIDDYEKPEKAYVFSFEGEKETCDNFNQEFLNTFKEIVLE